jgi:2',3'-cyclic-nucleotide 2'-phosphodiesterase (5'-nucleotidase family)
LREQSLGVELAEAIPRAHKTESPLGNLVTDLMRAAHPADVALLNGGGLRADLPVGPLTYGRLYEALPFDNRLATIATTAGQLAAVIATNLSRDGGILSVSGVRAVARCTAGAPKVGAPKVGTLTVTIVGANGRPLAPETALTVVTSEFLATGGDDVLPQELQRRATLDSGPLLRDAVATQLRARRRVPTPRELADPATPRLSYPGQRPVRCDLR